METEYHANGVVKSRKYTVNGISHRNNDPNRFAEQNALVCVRCNDAGVLIEEAWFQNERRHRDDGLAIRRWDNAGGLIYESWWQDGRELTPTEIEELLRPSDIVVSLREGLPQRIFEEIGSAYQTV